MSGTDNERPDPYTGPAARPFIVDLFTDPQGRVWLSVIEPHQTFWVELTGFAPPAPPASEE